MGSIRWLDLLVIVAYMAALIMVGVRFSRRQTSTERYFVAKRSIPAWAMGLSLLATLISSVTFIAYPGSAYAGTVLSGQSRRTVGGWPPVSGGTITSSRPRALRRSALRSL